MGVRDIFLVKFTYLFGIMTVDQIISTTGHATIDYQSLESMCSSFLNSFGSGDGTMAYKVCALSIMYQLTDN